MRYSEFIKLEKEGINTMLNSVNKFLLEHGATKDGLVRLLNQYTNYSEGRGKVYDCAVETDSVQIKTNISGRFVVDYSVHYFFGCEDITTQADQRMRIDYKLDPESEILELTGEYWPERDPGY